MPIKEQSIPLKNTTMNRNIMNSKIETSGQKSNRRMNMASNNRNDESISIGEEEQQIDTESKQKRLPKTKSWGRNSERQHHHGWGSSKKHKISLETAEEMKKRDLAIKVAREKHSTVVNGLRPQWKAHHKFCFGGPLPSYCFDHICRACDKVVKAGLDKRTDDPQGIIELWDSSKVRVVACQCCPQMRPHPYDYAWIRKECQCPSCQVYCQSVVNKICDCTVCLKREKEFRGVPCLPDWLLGRLPSIDNGVHPQGSEYLPTVPNARWTQVVSTGSMHSQTDNVTNTRENEVKYWALRDGLEQMDLMVRRGTPGSPMNNIRDLVFPENRSILDDTLHLLKEDNDFVSTVTLSCLAGQSPNDIMYLLSLEGLHEGAYSIASFPNHGIPDGGDEDDSRDTLFNVALQCNAEWRLLFYILEIDPWAILKLNGRGETVMHQAKLWRMDGRAVGEVFCCAPVSSLLMDSEFAIPMHKKTLAHQLIHTGEWAFRNNRFDIISPLFPPFPRDHPWSIEYGDKVDDFFSVCATRIAKKVLALRLKGAIVAVTLIEVDKTNRIKHNGKMEIEVPCKEKEVFALPVGIFLHIASFTSPCLLPEPAYVAAVHLIFTQRELIQLHHAGFGSNIKANGYRRALAWEQESRVTHDLPQYAQNSVSFD